MLVLFEVKNCIGLIVEIINTCTSHIVWCIYLSVSRCCLVLVHLFLGQVCVGSV